MNLGQRGHVLLILRRNPRECVLNISEDPDVKEESLIGPYMLKFVMNAYSLLLVSSDH